MRHAVLCSLLLSACNADSSATPPSPDAPAPPAPDAPTATPDAPPSTGLGTVTASSQPCDASLPATNLPATTCSTVTVSCPGLPDLVAELRVTPPAPNTTPRGTITFGIGGGGTGWWEGGQATSPSTALCSNLASAGFRVVQRRWTSDWEAGPGGMIASSCRYATLLSWLHDHVHQSGAFCAGGNSGGSTEVSYALAHWGLGSIVDMAIPTGGPPMGRIDRGCLDVATDPQWCSSMIPAGWQVQPTCGYTLATELLHIDESYSPATPCMARDETMRPTFLADSVAASAATYSFPQTKIDFAWGMKDGSYAVASGLLFAQAVTSEKSLQYIPDAPHPVMQVTQGAQAIYNAIMADCVPRH